MNDETPNLQLPYISPDQAQKHVTHNEALQRLDGLSQITILDITATPPAAPAAGDGYGIATGATGLWSGHEGELALYQDGYWLFTKPKRGWLAWLESKAWTYYFDGSAWQELKPSQLVLQDQLQAPPASPLAGATYGVLAGATGAWAGHDGDTTVQQAGNWVFTRQNKGTLAWQQTKASLMCFDGTAWFDLKPAQQAQQTQQTQLVLQDLLTAPPASPVAAATYGVAAGASGAWAGHDGETAVQQAGSWVFTKQKKGTLAWLESKTTTICYDGTGWWDLKTPQLALQDLLTTPPASPVAGATYAVMAGANGVWTGHDGDTAVQQSGSWVFTRQKKGTLAWLESKTALYSFDGTGWQDVKGAPPAANPNGSFDTVGINATASLINRLAVSSGASLFTHAGKSHQLTINKASDTDTASVLFQNAYVGKAEIGLVGADNLSFKTWDGKNWLVGLSIDPNGIATLPNRPLTRFTFATGSATLQSVVATSYIGFLEPAAKPTNFDFGATVTTANMGKAVKIKVAGLYLIQINIMTGLVNASTVAVQLNGATIFAFPLAGAQNGGPYSAMTLASLKTDDLIQLAHTAGSAKYDFSKSDMVLAMLG